MLVLLTRSLAIKWITPDYKYVSIAISIDNSPSTYWLSVVKRTGVVGSEMIIALS